MSGLKKGVNMSQQRQIKPVWEVSLVFTRLLGAFKVAIEPAKLVIALSALAAVCLLGYVLDVCAMTIADTSQAQKLGGTDVAAIVDFRNPAQVAEYVADTKNTMELIERYNNTASRGVFSTLWNFGAARFNGATVLLLKLDTANIFANIGNALANMWLCIVALAWAIKYHTVYSVIYFSFAVVVVCICGGAICRSAALEFARGEKPGLIGAMRFSMTRFGSLLLAPAISAATTLFFAAWVFLLGLTGNLPWVGELVIGVCLIVAMLF